MNRKFHFDCPAGQPPTSLPPFGSRYSHYFPVGLHFRASRFLYPAASRFCRFWTKSVSMSMGIGKSVVEFCSAAISTRVCR
jgi:hypothetical protein